MFYYGNPRSNKQRSKKVQVRNIPSHLNWEELDKLLAEYGTVENCEQVSTESDSATVNVTYSNRNEAQAAIRELNGKQVEGSKLKVNLLPDPSDANRNNRGNRYANQGYHGPYNGNGYMNRPKHPDLPTRIDVHRRENPGASDKAVTINGSPDGCISAAIKILAKVREEDKNVRMADGTWEEDEEPLKILAHNSLIGRLIGKDGRHLKAVQGKVETKISISNMADMSMMNAERTITIEGDLTKSEEALKLIMDKLRACYEHDMQSAYQGGPPNGFMGPPQGMYGAVQPFGPMQPPSNQITENCVLYIPANAVGAIIGTKGSHIRNVSRIANASIKISPPENGDGDKERKVTIVGTPEGQWKSQFCIFDKLKQEGFFGNDEGRLTSEINIPAPIIGRVIGKGGSNVRELQRLTNSEVIIPRQSETEGMEEVPVKIVGHFFAIQSAQRKIRDLSNKSKDNQNKLGVKNHTSFEG